MALINELRIGNTVSVDGLFITVESINSEGINIFVDDDVLIEYASFGDDDYHVKPIELTEEWLIKFGFELNVDGYWIDRNNIVFDMGCLCIGNYFESEKDHYQLVGAEITHVHSFQNGYMFLTGEEVKTTK